MLGQVIGVNVAIAASANNIGFAIPVNDVKPVIESVQKSGKIVRPFLGVRYQILTQERAKELQLSGVSRGALLVGDEGKGEFAVIPGGPGDKAGLKKGDVILEVDGKEIGQDFSLQQAVRSKKVGDSIRLKVWSSGKISEKSLTLGQAPND
jgi:serine protease Do